MLQKVKEFLLVQLIALAHWLLRSTWRFEHAPLPPEIQKRVDAGLPSVFGHLHQDDVTLSAAYVGVDVGVMVSHSKDGNLLKGFFDKIGFRVARGSSSRGAASGFLELLRISKDEHLRYITFAVDGPRGPVGKTKNGIFKLAEILDAPIVPTVALADRRWIFRRSWSKAFIPKPFARIEIKYLAPIPASEIRKEVQAKNYSTLAALFDKQIATAKSREYY